MARHRSALSVIFLTVFLDLLGFGIVIPVLPLLAKRFHASAFDAALLSSIYSLMQLVFAPIWGRLSDRVGRRPVLLVSITGAAASYVAFAFARTYVVLLIARAAAGVCAANLSTAQAYIADVTGPEDRARGMGLIGAAFGLGFVLGPFAGGELHRVSLAAPFLFAAALAAANFLWALLVLPEPRSRAEREAGAVRRSRGSALAAALRRPGVRLLLVLCLVVTFAFSNLEGTFVFYTKDTFGYDETLNGRLFAYIGILMAVVQGGLIKVLVRRFGERVLIPAGIASIATGFLLLPLCGPIALLGPLALVAVGSAVNSPSMSALVSKQVGAGEQGETLGVYQSVSSLGRVLGPAAGGLLYDGVSHGAPYFFGGVLLAGAALVAATLLGRVLAAAPAAAAS